MRTWLHHENVNVFDNEEIHAGFDGYPSTEGYFHLAMYGRSANSSEQSVENEVAPKRRRCSP